MIYSMFQQRTVNTWVALTWYAIKNDCQSFLQSKGEKLRSLLPMCNVRNMSAFLPLKTTYSITLKQSQSESGLVNNCEYVAHSLSNKCNTIGSLFGSLVLYNVWFFLHYNWWIGAIPPVVFSSTTFERSLFIVWAISQPNHVSQSKQNSDILLFTHNKFWNPGKSRQIRTIINILFCLSYL